MLRWVFPISIAVLAMFGAVVYVLSREASLRKLEAQEASERAQRAGERAASFYVSLTEQAARRKELEADVARLEEQYQSSRLTREQLASRLAQTEGELSMMAEREKAQLAKLRLQLESLTKLEEETLAQRSNIEQSDARTTALNAELSRERNRAQEQLSDLTHRLRAAETSSQEAEARVHALELRVARLQGVQGLPPAVRPGAQTRDVDL